MKGVVIIGTDTGVGKTTVCAGILKCLAASRKTVYWKPIQTGTIVGDDTQAVKAMTELSPEHFWSSVYRFPEPLSPHMAAKKWGRTIEMDTLINFYTSHAKDGSFVVVEGAGGVLLPFNEKNLQIDFLKLLKLPILVVSQDRVGAINQTLLTVNALRAEKIEVLGVILTRARKTLGNAEAITTFGKIPVLAEFDPSEDSRSIVARVAGSSALRTLFNEETLPK